MMDFVVFIVLMEAIVGLIAIIFVPEIITRNVSGISSLERVETNNEIRKMLCSALGVVLIVSAALGAWREHQQTVYNDFGKEANAAFTLINSTETVTRIGGVYGVSRVIKNSPDDAPILMAALLEALHQWSSKSARPTDDEIKREALVAFRVIGSHLGELNIGCNDFTISQLNLQRITARDLNFAKCKIAATSFSGSELTNLSLRGAKLIDVDFTDSDLTNADFSESYLDGVDFREADLSGASFANVEGLEASSFMGAKINKTKFPANIEKEIKSLIEGS